MASSTRMGPIDSETMLRIKAYGERVCNKQNSKALLQSSWALLQKGGLYLLGHNALDKRDSGEAWLYKIAKITKLLALLAFWMENRHAHPFC